MTGKNIVPIVLENATTKAVSQEQKAKWDKKSPDHYLLNFGGKVSLMDLSGTDDVMIERKEQPITDFKEFVSHYFKMFNEKYGTDIKPMLIDKKEQYRALTTPKEAKADTTDVKTLNIAEEIVKTSKRNNVDLKDLEQASAFCEAYFKHKKIDSVDTKREVVSVISDLQKHTDILYPVEKVVVDGFSF